MAGYLLKSFTTNDQFLGWGFVGLFNKAVQHDSAPAHYGTVQNPGYAFPSLESQFQQAFTHVASVGHAQVGAIRFHTFAEMQKTGKQGCGQGKNVCLHLLAVVLNAEFHGRMLTEVLTIVEMKTP
jgi:hypothetical protein